MKTGILRQAVRLLSVSVPLLVVGCAEGYPDDLKYPPRADLLVLAEPKETGPTQPDPPGQLDEMVASVEKKGGKTFDPSKAPAEARAELEKALNKIFGRPSRPRVLVTNANVADLGKVGEDLLTLEMYDVSKKWDNLAKGAALYRRHCLHCHGLTGDGRGPTGPWVNPHPRDYRQGIFKFVSTPKAVRGGKARRADLIRTLEKGIEGTTMPSFALLRSEESRAAGEDPVGQLASYVIHLSIRGEIEYQTLKKYAEGGEVTFEPPDPERAGDVLATVSDFAEAMAADLLGQWAMSARTPPNTPKPPPPECAPDPKTGIPPAESIVRGYQKFIEASGNAACLSCHTDFGRQAAFRYDIWGTLARPANLTQPVYRGGRRPLDIYWRITGGIKGCGMPENDSLTPQQYWDLINFVQTLPYPRMLPDEVREKVYVPERAPGESPHAEKEKADRSER